MTPTIGIKRRLAMKKILVACSLLVGLLLVAPGVQAIVPVTDITYDITSDHATGGLGTAPFGTVELYQSGTDPVEVTVTLNTGYYFVTTGSADFMYFKFNGAGDVNNITLDGFDTAGMSGYTGSFNGDGTGAFSFGVAPTSPNPGNNPFSGVLMFDVSNVTVAALTQPNADGNIFVADIYSPITGNTGPADVSAPRVPEPVSLLFLGFGLISLSAARKRFKK
jgi:hypothetical protein